MKVKDNKYKWLKIALIGYLISMCGFLLFISFLPLIGRIIIYSGFVIGFSGLIMQFYIFIRTCEDERNKQ